MVLPYLFNMLFKNEKFLEWMNTTLLFMTIDTLILLGDMSYHNYHSFPY